MNSILTLPSDSANSHNQLFLSPSSTDASSLTVNDRSVVAATITAKPSPSSYQEATSIPSQSNNGIYQNKYPVAGNATQIHKIRNIDKQLSPATKAVLDHLINNSSADLAAVLEVYLSARVTARSTAQTVFQQQRRTTQTN